MEKCGLTYGTTVSVSRRPAMARVSRRKFLTTSAGALLALGAPRVGHGETAVKVGTAVLADYALAGPFIVAVEKGFFRAEGLNAEFVPFRGGPDLLQGGIARGNPPGPARRPGLLVRPRAGRSRWWPPTPRAITSRSTWRPTSRARPS